MNIDFSVLVSYVTENAHVLLTRQEQYIYGIKPCAL